MAEAVVLPPVFRAEAAVSRAALRGEAEAEASPAALRAEAEAASRAVLQAASRAQTQGGPEKARKKSLEPVRA